MDQMLWMMPGAKVKCVFADLRNVINFEVDDYFKILMKFDNGIMAEVEPGTYFLTDKMHDKWFERHWFLGGNKGSAYVDGFGPPPEGKILTEELPKVSTCHENYFENYIKAYHGEEDLRKGCSEWDGQWQSVSRILRT